MSAGAPGRSDSHVKVTYDDFLLFPDDGNRHELIEGEHYLSPSPNIKHQAILINLVGLLWSRLQEHPVGRAFCAPLDIVLSNADVVEPDLLYMSHERAASILTPQNVRGMPELVVEIASAGTRARDETMKYRLYEKSGVAEYWMIDPEHDAVTAYRNIEGRFARAATLTLDRHDVLTTSLLPGLQLPLARLFA
ncbi:MAG TPA: Uma2 family endonuclease [Vicinamibacterales bacterium]|nr:Uma2 family endonuclease [Vicinamibacterales bacterium]